MHKAPVLRKRGRANGANGDVPRIARCHYSMCKNRHVPRCMYSTISYRVMCMELKEFSARLSQLRMNRGISARDMSLSIGQSPSYINNIENQVSFPSMGMFFYICDQLKITPAEFFELESVNPTKEKELLAQLKGLRDEDLDHLIAIAKALKNK